MLPLFPTDLVAPAALDYQRPPATASISTIQGDLPILYLHVQHVSEHGSRITSHRTQTPSLVGISRGFRGPPTIPNLSSPGAGDPAFHHVQSQLLSLSIALMHAQMMIIQRCRVPHPSTFPSDRELQRLTAVWGVHQMIVPYHRCPLSGSMFS